MHDHALKLGESVRFLGAFLLLLFIFYPASFLVQAAPLTGDHWEQHYPWAYLLSQSLHQGKLPFWTSYLHSGFPIAAESQIGIFYLPNLLLYGVLPFHAAYSYMNLVHFLLAGWGIYAYTRAMGLRPPGALMAAVLYVFGAAFGGAYYNMTSLKTIAWFPLGLYCLENIIRTLSKRYSLLLGFSIGMSLVAGYLQMAVLTWLVFLIYAFARLFFFKDQKDQKLFPVLMILGLAGLIGVLIAAPQVFLTYLLSIESNRLGLQEDFAYIGSLSPFAVLTLLDPVLQYALRGNNLYCGVFSLFLIFYAFVNPECRKQKFFKYISILTLIALLLALGRWSPLYVALIKITHFYSFRIPAKFLGFICFGMAILAGIGFDHLWRISKEKQPLGFISQKTANAYYIFIGLFVVIGAIIFYFMTAGKDLALQAGEFYVRHFIQGRAGHYRSLDSYLAELPSYLDSLKNLFNLSNFENIRTLLFLITGLGFAGYLKKNGFTRIWLLGGLLFLFIDLYSYAWIDVKRDYDFYKTRAVEIPVLKAIKKENQAGKISRLYGARQQGESLALVPSTNMLYQIEDIGAYSPLVTKRYYETFGLFGNLNDSIRAASPDTDFILDHMPLLDAVGVSHILSKRALSDEELELLTSDAAKGQFFYRSHRPYKTAYFVSNFKTFPDWNSLKQEFLQPGFNPQEIVLLENEELPSSLSAIAPAKNPATVKIKRLHKTEDSSSWDVEISSPGFFILSETWFPGWIAHVNQKRMKIIRAYGLFQGIYLPQAGQYQISLAYHPFQPLTEFFNDKNY